MAEDSPSFFRLKTVFFSTVKKKYARADGQLVEAKTYLEDWKAAVASSTLTETQRKAELAGIIAVQKEIDHLHKTAEEWIKQNQKKLLPILPRTQNVAAWEHLQETTKTLGEAERRSKKALKRLAPVRVEIPLLSELNQSMASLCSTLQRQVPNVEMPTSTSDPQMEPANHPLLLESDSDGAFVDYFEPESYLSDTQDVHLPSLPPDRHFYHHKLQRRLTLNNDGGLYHSPALFNYAPPVDEVKPEEYLNTNTNPVDYSHMTMLEFTMNHTDTGSPDAFKVHLCISS